MKEFPPSIPLLSHNCFALRGRGDLSSPSPFMLFSRALTPSALLLPHSQPLLAVLHSKPHSTARDFISESEAGVIRSKHSGRDTSHLSVADEMKGGVFYVVSTSRHEEHPSLGMWDHSPHRGRHAATPFCSPRRRSQLGSSVFCCPFQSPPHLCEFHLLSVPINLMSPQPRQSHCRPQAGPSGKK